MRRILFILFLLLGAPAHAVAIPGVTTDASGSQEAAPAAEPDVEQKKAAYAALADVLENETSRKELIDQLRKVAATPPPEPVPTITPPTVTEEKNGTGECNRHQPALRRSPLRALCPALS